MRGCVAWVHGCTGARVRECVGAWVALGAWVHGCVGWDVCVGAWVRGYVGTWVRGCVGACVGAWVALRGCVGALVRGWHSGWVQLGEGRPLPSSASCPLCAPLTLRGHKGVVATAGRSLRVGCTTGARGRGGPGAAHSRHGLAVQVACGVLPQLLDAVQDLVQVRAGNGRRSKDTLSYDATT